MDIEQMCHHLGIAFENMPEHDDDSHNVTGSQHVDGRQSEGFVAESASEDLNSHRQDESPDFDWSRAAATFFDTLPSEGLDQPSMSTLSFGEGGYDPMGFYVDQFALTGVVETDWEELSRQFAN